MKRHRYPTVLTLLTLAALVLSSAAFPARADDAAPAPAVKAEVPAEVPTADTESAAEAVAPPEEPFRVSGKLHKVDLEGKMIVVLVEPDKDKSARAFRKYKLVLDDKSLILVDQQPSTISALASGQLVEVGYWKKGKEQVVDTVVVVGKVEY